MKRSIRISYLVMTVFWVSLSLMVPLGARADTGTANPPVVKIKLNGREPLPPGTAATVNFGGGGGGEQNARDSGLLYWYMIPPIVFYPREYHPLVACGYKSETPPRAILTTPSGKEQILPLEDTSSEPQCFWYALHWRYGMELGQYQIKLLHRDGTLTYRWNIQYSKTRIGAFLNKTQTLLMGFKPNETITLNFYDPQDEYSFVAARQVKVGSDGAVIVEIAISPSADLNLVEFAIAGFGAARFGPSRSWQRNDWLFPDRNKDPDQAIVDYWVPRCPNSPPTRTDNTGSMRSVGNQARTTYAGPGSEETGKLQPGQTYRLGDVRCGMDGLTYVRLERGNGDDPRKAIVGWVIEGKGSDYYLEPARNN